MNRYSFVVIIYLSLAVSAFAYNSSNDYGDHQNITTFAINKLTYANDEIQATLKAKRTSINSANQAEDSTWNLLHHFYDPTAIYLCSGEDRSTSVYFTSCALPNAKDYAISYYDLARKNNDWSGLGKALHLLQDVSVPSHVHRNLSGIHLIQSTITKKGYEWWVSDNWITDLSTFNETGYLDKIFNIPQFKYRIMAGDMAGFMDTMSEQTYFGGYPWDSAFSTISDYEAEYTAKLLIPMSIRMSGGLLERFYRDTTPPQSNNTGPGGGHADDNFDVSSRRIELEQLDVTKQAWKDLYGRTGIKKGYNGLFLEKAITESYAKMAATTTEADYSLAAQQFDLVTGRAQKEVKHSFEDTYYASADVALLSDAFVDNAAELLLKRLKEPIREVKETLNPAVLLKNQPVLLVPSGALTGFNDSPMLKASLDEYVKQGGTLIVLSQKHGYDYASIPTPDGRPITGYGWEEDQNCFADSVAIESWHQMLSGQSRSTPTLNVDGYFTGYPANSTILLRRTANGQPALLMYEHGLGRVVVTSMYSDWAYGHGQASQEEIGLMRDILSWAKKPATLPEIKPGESITVPVTLTNSTATDASSIKLQIWNPDRSTLLLEQAVSTSLPAGQSAINTVTWQAPSNGALGIYHIDYLLLDVTNTIIQPQAETDSGRFAVSNPPQVGTVKKDIWLSITSPNQEVFFNEPFVYTFHIFNNTATTRNLTLKTVLPHTGRTHERPVTATANGETTISGSDPFIDYNMFETLHAYLYDENNVQIGSYMLSFKGVFPQVSVTTATVKSRYSRGETVDLGISLGNSRSLATTVKLKVTVTDPANSIFFSNTTDVILPASGGASRSFSFPLPQAAQGGVYTLSSEVLDVSGKKIGGDSAVFEIPLRLVAITPSLSAGWQAGANQLSFNLVNLGIIPVTTGLLSVTLTDPDSATVAGVSQPFILDVGQTKNLDLSLAVPPPKFGVYTLAYNQGDEAGPGRNSSVSLANSVSIAANFDKPSYRIRETANLAVNLANSGRFSLNNVSVTMTVPDAGYTDTKTMNIGQGQTLPVQYAVPLPASMIAGQHNVTVTLTLPGGSAITKEFSITVPESLLAFSLTLSSSIAGGTVTPTISNIGGKDTTAEYRLTLYDAKYAQIADQSATASVPAGAAIALSLPIPLGAIDGVYTLAATYRNTITSQAAMVQKQLTVSGIKGALTLRSDKPSYLNMESITGLSTITNSGTALPGGIFTFR